MGTPRSTAEDVVLQQCSVVHVPLGFEKSMDKACPCSSQSREPVVAPTFYPYTAQWLYEYTALVWLAVHAEAVHSRHHLNLQTVRERTLYKSTRIALASGDCTRRSLLRLDLDETLTTTVAKVEAKRARLTWWRRLRCYSSPVSRSSSLPAVRWK